MSRRDKPVQVYVTEEDLAMLDSVAEDRQTSRSAAARGLLHRAIIAEVARIKEAS